MITPTVFSLKCVIRSIHRTAVCNIRKTYYEVLGVSKTASAGDIREAFLKKSKEYHPDSSGSSTTSDKFVELNEAYSVLVKQNTRSSYDRQLKYGHFHAHRGWDANFHTPHHQHNSENDNQWRQWEGSATSGSYVNPNVGRIFLTFAVVVIFLRFYTSYRLYRIEDARMRSLTQSQQRYHDRKDTPEYQKIRSELDKFYNRSSDVELSEVMQNMKKTKQENKTNTVR